MTLFLEAIGSIFRFLLAFLAGYLVRHGVWTQGAADAYVSAAATALAMAAISLGWSLWQKYTKNVEVATALSLPAGSSQAQLDTKMKSNSALPVILLAMALGAGALGLTSCAGSTPPPVVAPVVTAAQKALDITRKVGVIVEQVQIDELALYQAGKVPADVHAKVVKGLTETSTSVLTAIDTLSAASSATSAHDLVLAITTGLKKLAGDLGHLSGAEAARLAGVLDTAASLIEVALS